MTSVRHYFPYTGEYVLKVRFAGMARPPETVDIRIDGARVAALETPGRSNYEDPVDEGAVEARVTVDAGPHVVGVSFRKATLMNETRYPQYFPWGNSATFATNTGSVAPAQCPFGRHQRTVQSEGRRPDAEPRAHLHLPT